MFDAIPRREFLLWIVMAFSIGFLAMAVFGIAGDPYASVGQ